MSDKHNTTLGRIYCDFAASTPVAPEVMAEMMPYWSEHFGNASAVHAEGRAAKEAIESARARCAEVIGGTANGIYFTSGGTEGNNFAVFGVVDAYLAKTGKSLNEVHIITLSVEHSSLLDCVRLLERRGASVTYLPVDREGRLDLNDLREALRPETVLVSLMLVNSEIGVVYPLKECVHIIREYRRIVEQPDGTMMYPVFHTDASQGCVYLDCDVRKLGVDVITMDAQKVYGPKGVGFVHVARGVPIAPVLHGGGQERGLRPGTPNTPLIVGMAKAFELANERRDAEVERMTPLRDHFIDRVLAEVPGAELNGARDTRIANNASIAIPGKHAEMLLLRLDSMGIACSTKSPCKGVSGGSHVILALGKGEACATGTLRFSFGRSTTAQDIDRVVDALAEVVKI